MDRPTIQFKAPKKWTPPPVRELPEDGPAGFFVPAGLLVAASIIPALCIIFIR